MAQPKKKNIATKKVNKKRPKADKKPLSDKFPLLVFSIKTFALLAVVLFIINHYENKGYFNANNVNNHTRRKWNKFYEFTEANNVDVLLIGSSHLYTGINPKNLSAALGVNSFILASPGTNIADNYFALKEALKQTKPKVVVIETYGMTEFNPYLLKGQTLSDQFKSFYARKDFFTKLESTPYLFKSDNYLYAWYNLFRNHDYLYKDTAQLNKNIKLIKNPPLEKDELYLGRYVRFLSGIKKNTLQKYDSLGAPVNGDSIVIGEYSKMYSNKINDLCEAENIELVYLTLPMYHQHVKNYTTWHNSLAEVITPQNASWLDLQYNYDTVLFDTNAFENTYKENQHMTYNGSLIATYKLKEFIDDSLQIDLPNRKEEPIWRNNFYGEEGYFENAPVFSSDTKNKLIASNMTFGDLKVIELSLIPIKDKKNKILMAKIKVNRDYDRYQLRKCYLTTFVEILDKNKKLLAQVNMTFDFLHPNKDYLIFKSVLKPVQVTGLKSAQFNCKF